jgi:hypothetical protein
MPFDTTIDAQKRVTVIRAWGPLGMRDLLEQREALRRDPRFDPGSALLLDMSGISELMLSDEQMRTLAGGSAFASGVRRAFVVRDFRTVGVSGMYSTLRELSGDRGETAAFGTVEEALTWLERVPAPSPVG